MKFKKMSIQKITKEELLEKLGGTPLSDDELEKVAGGDAFSDCLYSMENSFNWCKAQCGNEDCPYECEKTFADNVAQCIPLG